jgi:hypothetical protein
MQILIEICGSKDFIFYHVDLKFKNYGERRREKEYTAAVWRTSREMEEKQRSPRTDCRCYDPDTHDCHALTGLWCEWEDCKFYKGADTDVEEKSVRQRDLPVLP